MLGQRQAEIVRDLKALAMGRRVEGYSRLMSDADRLAEVLEGKPRSCDEVRRRRAKLRKSLGVLAALTISMSGAHAAPAPRSYAQEACAELRAMNPTYTMPIHFACIQSVTHSTPFHRWFTMKVTHFYCPELDGAKFHKVVDMIDWPTNPRNCDDPNAVMH